MRVISFFSRFTVVCNIAFLLFVFFSKRESSKPANQGQDVVSAIPYFKNLIIVLGVSAIVINLVICIVYSVFVVIGRQRLLHKWLVVINFLFLILQFLYFFYR